jgi:3-dehydrosphinganine reductase
MGRATAVLLASKGANVIIVARSKEKLALALEEVKQAAAKSTQRFHFISTDLTSSSACAEMLRSATEWNDGTPPDIVWCCAGSATPTLFIDTDPAELKAQMDSNYMTAAYTAHATLRAWLRPDSSTPTPTSTDARHLIFTSSFLGLFAVAGYAPYTPAKTALRGLADSLAMEMQLYTGAAAGESKRIVSEVKLHTVYPATIFSDSHEHEQQLKSDLTKKLEEDDLGQTPAQVAAESVRGLERGEELVSTALLTRAVAASVLGGTRGVGFIDRALSWVMTTLGIMSFVRWDMDKKTYNWGKQHGPSGMKKTSS